MRRSTAHTIVSAERREGAAPLLWACPQDTRPEHAAESETDGADASSPEDTPSAGRFGKA